MRARTMQQYKVHLEYCTFGRYRVDDAVLVVQAASPILAAEKAERLAADLHGGELDWWFAYEVDGPREPHQAVALMGI